MSFVVVEECSLSESTKIPEGHAINKCALKLLGLDSSDLNDAEILEYIAEYVEPSSIKALFFDAFHKFHVLFLSEIQSACFLVGKIVPAGVFHMHFLPLLDCYVISNVYPSLTNCDLRDAFRTFGNVFEVTNYHILPNSSKFAHVLSGKREISFLLPGEQSEVIIPSHVQHSPYLFHVTKLCSACLTEGHSILECPDIDELDTRPLESDDSSNSELNSIIKTENIPDVIQEDLKEEVPSTATTLNSPALSVPTGSVASSTVEIKADGEVISTTKTRQMSENNVVDSTEDSEYSQLDKETVKKRKVSDKEKVDSSIEISPEYSETSQLDKETLKKRKVSDERKVDSSNVISPVNKGMPTVHTSELNFNEVCGVPKNKMQFTPEAEECIQNSVGVLPPEILTHIIRMDARNKNDIASQVLNFTQDMPAVLKQFKRLRRKCYYSQTFYDPKFYKKLVSMIGVLTKCIK